MTNVEKILAGIGEIKTRLSAIESDQALILKSIDEDSGFDFELTQQDSGESQPVDIDMLTSQSEIQRLSEIGVLPPSSNKTIRYTKLSPLNELDESSMRTYTRYADEIRGSGKVFYAFMMLRSFGYSVEVAIEVVSKYSDNRIITGKSKAHNMISAARHFNIITIMNGKCVFSKEFKLSLLDK